MPTRFLAALGAALLLSSPSLSADTFTGTASHYGCGDGLHGHRQADGTLFNAYGLSAAHRSLPLGTEIKVWLVDKAGHRKGQPVVVEVKDRGPAVWTGKNLDLSCGAAKRLGFYTAGKARFVARILK